MPGIRHCLSNWLIICGIWGLVRNVVWRVQMICTGQVTFCCILHNFVFGGRSVTPLMDTGNTFPLSLLQAAQQPRKMM